MKKIFGVAILVMALSLMVASAYAAAGDKAKDFVEKVVTYPAKVTVESAKVVGNTAKGGADIVAKEATTTGQVVTGDVAKTKDLVVDPLTGTAQTAKDTVEGTANVPAVAAK